MKLNKKMRQVLDMEIEQTELSRSVKRYCRSHGLKLVGEIFYFHFDRTSPTRREIEQFLADYGLVLGLDVVAFGWRPTYADNPAIRAIWNQPANTVLRPEVFDGDLRQRRRAIGYNRYFAGNWINQPNQRDRPGLFIWRQSRLRSDSNLHAGMLALGWRQPKGEPEFVTKMEEEWRAELEAQAEAERVRREQIANEPSKIYINELGLSVRAYNILHRADIKTLDQLEAMTEDNLRVLKHSGERFVQEIIDKLAEFGRKLKESE